MSPDPDRLPPRPVAPSQSHISAAAAQLMVGKTVASVEFGDRRPIPNVHQGELLVIHFADGTSLAVDTGSNALNLSDRGGPAASEFHTDFVLEWYGPVASQRLPR